MMAFISLWSTFWSRFVTSSSIGTLHAEDNADEVEDADDIADEAEDIGNDTDGGAPTGWLAGMPPRGAPPIEEGDG